MINSEAGTVSQGLMVIEAGRMCQNGVPYEQCVDILEKMKKTNRIFFTVGNTDYLKHGGRIGKLAGIASSALSLKPLITLVNGEIEEPCRSGGNLSDWGNHCGTYRTICDWNRVC